MSRRWLRPVVAIEVPVEIAIRYSGLRVWDGDLANPTPPVAFETLATCDLMCFLVVGFAHALQNVLKVHRPGRGRSHARAEDVSMWFPSSPPEVLELTEAAQGPAIDGPERKTGFQCFGTRPLL